MVLSQIETNDGFQIVIGKKQYSIDTEYPETTWRVSEYTEDGLQCIDAGIEKTIDKCLEKALFCIVDWKKQCDEEDKRKRTNT